MDRHLWIDGEIRPADSADVSALAAGCQFGEGVFETVRIEGGMPLWISAHARRLARAVEAFGLGPTLAVRDMREAFRELARVEGAERAVGRMTVLVAHRRTPGPRGVDAHAAPESATAPRVRTIVHLRAVPEPLAPIDVVFATTRRDPRDVRFAHKTTSAIDRLHAADEAARRGASDVLSVNHDGTIGEGLWSNVFFVAGDVLVTPTRDCGILTGVQRGRVLRLAKQLGLDVAERPVPRDEVASFDACFLTNVARGLIRVGRLEGRAFPGDRAEVVSRLEQTIERDRSYGRSRYGAIA